MDPNPEEDSGFETGSNQHVLKKVLYDEDTNKSSSSSSSNTKQPEESKKTSSSIEKSPEEDNVERPSSQTSPEPNCAICLEPLQNKSFSNSCCHTFCFTCLLEWSKVKPECPLCKIQFKSILHNVHNNIWDEYFINSKTGRLFSYYSTESQRFRYSTTMTTSRIMERNRITFQDTAYQSQIASHRMRFAPHSVNMYSSSQTVRLPCPFRRRVYEQDLWVKASLNFRTRLATPEFYKRNPACTHRLVPWLNRELVSILPDREAPITFILELIMSLVVRFHIRSQEFLCHVEPYLGRNIHHFVHEFFAFAISPHDMEDYDELADYGLASLSTDSQSTAERSSPDSDVIAVFTGANTSNQRRKRAKNPKLGNRTFQKLKMILKKSQGNSWQSYLSSATGSILSASNWANPGPSTSGINFITENGNTNNIISISDVELTDDDEVQILDVIKPVKEKNPEIVDLSSDEEDSETVIDVSSDEESFHSVCSTPTTSPTSSIISLDDASSEECPVHKKTTSMMSFDDVSSEECPVHKKTTNNRYTPTSSETSEDSFDNMNECPIHKKTTNNRYTLPSSETSSESFDKVEEGQTCNQNENQNNSSATNVDHCNSSPTNVNCHNSSSTNVNHCNSSPTNVNCRNSSPTNVDHHKPLPTNVSHYNSSPTNYYTPTSESEVSTEEEKKPKLASAIVRPWTAERDPPHHACVPRTKRHRSSSSGLDYSSSESSDSDRSSSRKFKLQSVVACFEINRRSHRRESSHHRSSRKKHKEKKKKKHKRIRRRKNCIYSESE